MPRHHAGAAHPAVSVRVIVDGAMARLASGEQSRAQAAEIAQLRSDVESMRSQVDSGIRLAAAIARDDTIRVLAEYESIRERLRAGRAVSWPAEAPMTPTRHWEGDR